MTEFKMYDQETAPMESKLLLDNSVNTFGMIPNLHAVLAESPQTLEAYQRLHELFLASSLTAEEKTVVWQTLNVEHECVYCVPAHSFIAKAMKVDPKINDALRNEEALESEKLETLRKFVLELARNRGHVSDETLAEFFEAGYNNQHILEIILGLTQKVMSNYTNHIVKTPTDDVFNKFYWEKKKD